MAKLDENYIRAYQYERPVEEVDIDRNFSPWLECMVANICPKFCGSINLILYEFLL